MKQKLSFKEYIYVFALPGSSVTFDCIVLILILHCISPYRASFYREIGIPFRVIRIAIFIKLQT